MPITQTYFNETYDGDGNLISSEEVVVDVTEEVRRENALARFDTAIARLDQIINAANPTNAQTVAAVQDLARYIKHLGRLHRTDLLLDDAQSSDLDT